MSNVIHCPDGLVNDPARFLNFVDKSCVPYTTLELILFAGGCLMWVVAYGIIIRNASRLHFMDMAVVAGCSNFAWEFLWAFAFRTDMGWFLVYTYRAWFFLDLFIFWLLLKHGGAQISTPALARHFKPLAVATTLFFTAAYYFFTKEGHDTYIGANSAYIAQIFISVLCLTLLLRRPNLQGLSFHVAWLRSFGTGANTVFMFLHYPDNHFLHVISATSFVLDMFYLYLYRKYRRALSGGSATRVMAKG